MDLALGPTQPPVDDGDAIPDTFVSDVGQIIAPDGSVSYEFEGRISSQGIDVVSGNVLAPIAAANAVRWHKDTVTGALLGTLATRNNPTASRVDLVATPPDGSGSASLIVSAHDTDTQQRTVGASIGLLNKTVLDGDERSSFLQLAGLANRSVDFGNSTMPFGGGAGPALRTVNHGLGIVPRFIVATYLFGGNQGLFVYVQARSAADITFRGIATAGGFGDADFMWIAIDGDP